MSRIAAEPSIFKAAAWMTGTLLSFTFMAIASQRPAAEIHTFEMLAMRSLVGLIIVTYRLAFRLAPHSDISAKASRERNIVHFGGQSTWIFGLSLLPLAVFAIEFTIPIWVALLAVILVSV